MRNNYHITINYSGVSYCRKIYQVGYLFFNKFWKMRFTKCVTKWCKNWLASIWCKNWYLSKYAIWTSHLPACCAHTGSLVLELCAFQLFKASNRKMALNSDQWYQLISNRPIWVWKMANMRCIYIGRYQVLTPKFEFQDDPTNFSRY